MPGKMIRIKCSRCDHRWALNTAQLDENDRFIYREGQATEGPAYRIPCPQCGTYVIFTVKDDGDG